MRAAASREDQREQHKGRPVARPTGEQTACDAQHRDAQRRKRRGLGSRQELGSWAESGQVLVGTWPRARGLLGPQRPGCSRDVPPGGGSWGVLPHPPPPPSRDTPPPTAPGDVRSPLTSKGLGPKVSQLVPRWLPLHSVSVTSSLPRGHCPLGTQRRPSPPPSSSDPAALTPRAAQGRGRYGRGTPGRKGDGAGKGALVCDPTRAPGCSRGKPGRGRQENGRGGSLSPPRVACPSGWRHLPAWPPTGMRATGAHRLGAWPTVSTTSHSGRRRPSRLQQRAPGTHVPTAPPAPHPEPRPRVPPAT